MKQAQFNDKQLEIAWEEIEQVFNSSGMVEPAPGFTARWNERLQLEKQQEDRRQAWMLIIMNLVIALGFLGLIAIQIAPSLSTGSSLLDIWVDMVSRMIVNLKMVGGVLGTLGRTLPGVIPTSWLMTGITALGIMVAVWASMVRQHIRNQGVSYEQV
ncbi:MAG: hypothetical protein ABFS17_11590 [Chloroflexota bacterium]